MRTQVVVCIVACAVIGCQDGGGSAPPTGASVGTTPKPSDPKSTQLRDGMLPMTYMLGGGGKIRIVDATTKKQIARTTAPPQAAIHVNADRGVVVNDKTITNGPLPKDHRYEIWLDR
jgi:hypothetical protein